MKYLSHKLLYIMLICLSIQVNVCSAQEFVIEDIRVEGLQRITPGTVFNYLPIKVGDVFDDSKSSESASILFETGFFEDIKLERDGGVLIFILEERPSIGSITLNGNADVSSEDLLDSLKQINFSEGRSFDRSQLEKLEQELTRQYNSLGKYSAKIESTVTELDNNRVAITIDISEGVVAKIKKINITGNKVYEEKELLELFTLEASSLLSFYTSKDKYSRQKLSTDLESLRSHYLNNGYINFNIDSTQVSITPDKKNIYITINISEGELFTISEVSLVGNFVLPEEELSDLISIRVGDIFSRKQLTNSSDALNVRLGNDGYTFANVNSIPEINNENYTIKVKFFVDSGKRVYVGRIIFNGNTKTRDEVLRREMRQQESSWITTEKVERGRVRLQRLGFFEEVNVETLATAGTTDQVDIHYTIEERSSGNLSLGFGFSQTGGLSFQTSVTQNNFLGSGKRFSLVFNNSEINKQFGFSYVNPYYTADGISRSLNAFFRKTDSANANVIAFDNQVLGGSVGFGIPISEFNTLSTSIGYENNSIDATTSSSTQVADFIVASGDSFNILRWNNSLSFDTRNKIILPSKGSLHLISTELALPSFGDSLQFYKVNYRMQWFAPVYKDYVLVLKGDVSFGDAYGDTDDLPFFENFYAGGPKSVRGYKENTLGSLDSLGRPLGGNFRLITGAEVILPVPFFKDNQSVRLSIFFDTGNVYDLSREDFDIGELRYSVGLSGIWISPFGLISASIAKPIASQGNDQIQNFQFTFGTSF